ncbi:hypothetical protein N7519_006161 [Penicillium mononematosum]|uniref:uncharacterized protein n=1 Tax=Penicillium mononematosum TaxID=268346 RepID=UPI00254926AC|nr:uncharacterized protein N7519_006161 [Penicillium mononematosum]KAJ6184860.1 hypothetical protein N7519_006161 [Penicillium mononematosum]
MLRPAEKFVQIPSRRLRAKNHLSTMSFFPMGPKNPSKRDPTESTKHQVADQLERLMDENGHKTWGFVLYRCTYKSDSDWEKFMHQYLKPVKTSLERNNGLNILDRFRPTVFEDRRFDGATSFAIRDHFNQWVAIAPQQEQGIPAEVALATPPGRYKFCLMVDEESLQSVINRPADMDEYADERDHSAYVILVSGSWNPEMEEIDDEELEEYGGVYEPEVFDAVDGCTEWDVGCMRAHSLDTFLGRFPPAQQALAPPDFPAANPGILLSKPNTADTSTADQSHTDLFKDVLHDTNSPALALQALITRETQAAYYEHLMREDPTASALTVFSSTTLIPVRWDGFVAGVSIIVVHFIILAVITVLFVIYTTNSMIGNSWQAVAQVVSEDMLTVLDHACKEDDEKVKKRWGKDQLANHSALRYLPNGRVAIGVSERETS